MGLEDVGRIHLGKNNKKGTKKEKKGERKKRKIKGKAEFKWHQQPNEEKLGTPKREKMIFFWRGGVRFWTIIRPRGYPSE
jgi:hypothetical protein